MTPLHRLLAGLAATLGVAAGLAGQRSAVDATGRPSGLDTGRAHISAPALAERIMRGDPALRVFDLRPRADFERFHVPSARQATLDHLARDPPPRDASVVLYADDGAGVAQAWELLRAQGQRDVSVLREGVYEWIARVHEPRLAIDATAPERAEFERAAAMSRFFGGVPLAGVPREDVPAGYWTGEPRSRDLLAAAALQAVTTVRRRGC